jgi:ribonuclease P protein component
VKRRFRLTQSTDIKRVRHLGKSYAHPLIVLVVLSNEQQGSRIGIVTGRSIGGAVQRNRAKRLLRAALQPLLTAINPGWDLLLIARQGMGGAVYSETQKALTILLQRARIYQEMNGQ